MTFTGVDSKPGVLPNINSVMALQGRRPSLTSVKPGIKFESVCVPLMPPTRMVPWMQIGPSHEAMSPQAYLATPLISSTLHLINTFSSCNPSFGFDRTCNPRRVLTKPNRPVHNHGFDNEKWDLILQVNDIIGEEESRRYIILDLLGHGTFGQVVKCQNMRTSQLVGIKVIKNQASYFNQSMMEVTVLEMLNNRFDRNDEHHVVRMLDTFVFRSHLCIVVELLSLNLYELIKQNQYRGFSLSLCRVFLAQCLDSLHILRAARIIHCDLKPENILLQSLDKPHVKIIDFGSACHEYQTVYTYIQSRFYRSPEVILGLPYSASIDMWSLGCIAAELFLGLPIFPGASNYDQVVRIVETFGQPPKHMLDVGKDSALYFERQVAGRQADGSTATRWTLKSREQYSQDIGKPEPPSKKYFNSTDLTEIIMSHPLKSAAVHKSTSAHLGGELSGSGAELMMAEEEKQKELTNRRCFLDFLRGLLCLNPIERWSPAQALQHPFISGKPFTMPFVPSTLARSGPVPTPSRRTPSASALEPDASTQRPRSNTLSTLHIRDVPPELQRLAAAVEESGGPPVIPADASRDDRLVPHEIDESTGLPIKARRGHSFVAPNVQVVERAAAAQQEAANPAASPLASTRRSGVFEGAASPYAASNARRRASLSTGNGGNPHPPPASPLHQVYDASQSGINILMEAAAEQDDSQTTEYDEEGDTRMMDDSRFLSPRNTGGGRRSYGSGRRGSSKGRTLGNGNNGTRSSNTSTSKRSY